MPVRGFNSHTSNGAVTTDFVYTVNVPAGTQRGDVLVWWVQSDYFPQNNSGIGVPDGFTVVPPSNIATTSGEYGQLAVGVRVATGAEPASYSRTMRAAFCGLITLSGVTIQGMRESKRQRDEVLTQPFSLVGAGFRVDRASELLWIAHANRSSTGNTPVNTAPTGFAMIVELSDGAYHQTLIAHKRLQRPGPVPATIATVTDAAGKTSGSMVFVLAFPIVSGTQRLPIDPVRAPLRRLRPTSGIANSGWTPSGAATAHEALATADSAVASATTAGSSVTVRLGDALSGTAPAPTSATVSVRVRAAG